MLGMLAARLLKGAVRFLRQRRGSRRLVASTAFRNEPFGSILP